jgi:hypothetical protein
MKRTILCIVAVCISASPAAVGVEFGPIFFGVHGIPSVEAGEGGRTWDLSLSIGLGAEFDAMNRLEVHVLTDSHLTSLGATALYHGQLTERLSGGVGATILWPLGEGQRLLRPLVEAFAHTTFEHQFGSSVGGEVSLSFPMVTLARRPDRWDLIPLAELPSLSFAAVFDVAVDGALRAQVTLQPVIVDTTQLERPIGRLTDNLLVLPSLSGFALYAPPR